MRYLVSITPDEHQNNEIDRSGEVMPLLDFLKRTFKPEAFYLEAARRKIWMVAEFENGGDLNKLTCIGVFKFGAYPEFRPLLNQDQNDTGIQASLSLMESISGAPAAGADQ
jgi:hypothetical protein